MSSKSHCKKNCGGFRPTPPEPECEADEFCSIDGHCSAADEPGFCSVRPSSCPPPGPEDVVCGCDRREYPSHCEAHRAGVSVWRRGRCLSNSFQVVAAFPICAPNDGQAWRFELTRERTSCDERVRREGLRVEVWDSLESSTSIGRVFQIGEGGWYEGVAEFCEATGPCIRLRGQLIIREFNRGSGGRLDFDLRSEDGRYEFADFGREIRFWCLDNAPQCG
ncbi:MAG: hypothetical protein N2515_08595 [Deltaproteobacteria bacterium]|nr:hypothetical protein [Deltaproteobacteria bacterium]